MDSTTASTQTLTTKLTHTVHGLAIVDDSGHERFQHELESELWRFRGTRSYNLVYICRLLRDDEAASETGNLANSRVQHVFGNLNEELLNEGG